MTAALRINAVAVVGSDPARNWSARPATDTVITSDATLKMTRCSGFFAADRSVHCAQALTVAMQTACAGPRVKSAQKFTACESDRFDWLRPSGSSILTADVTIAIPISAVNNA